MTLQLDLVAPNLVSSDEKAHILQLVFYGSNLFKDVSGNMIAPGLTIRKDIPRQIDTSTGEKIEFLGKSFQTGFTWVFIANLFFISTMSVLLTAIRNLQILTHIQLANIPTPKNS